MATLSEFESLYIKHSNLLLKLETGEEKSLILAFSGALSEVFSRHQFLYSLGTDYYAFKGTKLKRKRFSLGQVKEKYKKRILLLDKDIAGRHHAVWFNLPNKIGEEAKLYIKLICKLCGMILYKRYNDGDEVPVEEIHLNKPTPDVGAVKEDLPTNKLAYHGILKSISNQLSSCLGFLELFSIHEADKDEFTEKVENYLTDHLFKEKNLIELFLLAEKITSEKAIANVEKYDLTEIIHESISYFSENFPTSNITFHLATLDQKVNFNCNKDLVITTLHSLYIFMRKIFDQFLDDDEPEITIGFEQGKTNTCLIISQLVTLENKLFDSLVYPFDLSRIKREEELEFLIFYYIACKILEAQQGTIRVTQGKRLSISLIWQD